MPFVFKFRRTRGICRDDPVPPLRRGLESNVMHAQDRQVAVARRIRVALIAAGFVAVTLSGAAESLALSANAPLWAELALLALFLIGCLTVGLLSSLHAIVRVHAAPHPNGASEALPGTTPDSA